VVGGWRAVSNANEFGNILPQLYSDFDSWRLEGRLPQQLTSGGSGLGFEINLHLRMETMSSDGANRHPQLAEIIW